MKVALYARVSTERQAERGTIGSQLQVLREHVTASGDELAGEYADDGQSGARPDRPGLDALRDAAEAGLFELVWCLSPDRLGGTPCTRNDQPEGWGLLTGHHRGAQPGR